MKLLALRLCEHDSSFCYFDGCRLRYIKTERLKGVKHHAYNNLQNWVQDFEQIFSETISNINEIAIILDPWHYNLPQDKEYFATAIECNALDVPCKVWRINHHYAHALSVWMLAQKLPEISVVIDGFGDYDQAWTVFKRDQVLERGSLQQHGSLGIAMAETGKSLGITAQYDIDIAGKLMGLQSYGNLSQDFYLMLQDMSLKTIKQLFSYKKWIDFNGDNILAQLTPLDWIHTVHRKTGHLLVEFVKKFATSEQIISFTGGIAQNVLWNTELKKHFKNIIIPPHSADEGLTFGAIEWLRIKNNLSPFKLEYFPYLQLDQSPGSHPTQDTIEQVAYLLSIGKTVGWYQGHGEVGPRALGNRSILLDPRISNGKNIINNIKRREKYRPFGAVVLHEYCADFFDTDYDPYMLFTAKVKNLKLNAITHVDGTCRVQTLKNENPLFRSLIKCFHKITGCPVLLNTSLNLAGKPLAGTIEDAVHLYKSTPLDVLVIGNTVYRKN